MEITRDTSSSPEWWLDDPQPKARDTYDPEQGTTALEYLAETLEQMRDALAVQDYVLTDATRCLVENADVQGLVDTVALIQDLKRALGVAEAYVAREAGYLAQEFSTAKAGQTSDGRPYEIMRGNVRKAWDHAGWQADVRREIVADATLDGTLLAVSQVTGADHDLRQIVSEAVTRAQAIHGSAAPKVTALKALGVDPGDYCESTPGPYTVKITQSAPTATTTTGE